MPVDRKKKEKPNFENGTPVGLAAKEGFTHQAKERLAGLPDVRPERVQKALLRVSQGFYDRPAVVAKIADRFLEEMGID
ncbi:MAG: hypothetical protein L0Z48_01180 [candidate division Zixibacteria bacterium]|nr:hypothetical protein [candidate division Zixibacteria bacterium]MCI0595136.1 hypothetical protein [candidate division Zixibacteria bacterium]